MKIAIKGLTTIYKNNLCRVEPERSWKFYIGDMLFATIEDCFWWSGSEGGYKNWRSTLTMHDGTKYKKQSLGFGERTKANALSKRTAATMEFVKKIQEASNFFLSQGCHK